MNVDVPIRDEMIASASPVPAWSPWSRRARDRYGSAAVLSVALHGVVGLLLVGVVVQTPAVKAPIRVFFYDPAPPPPLAGGAPVAAPVPAPAEAVAQPQPVPHPESVMHRPVPRIRKRAAPAVAPVNPLPDTPGAVPAEAGGVVGGVPNGLPGGTVGGTGSIISADQAAYQPRPISKVMPQYPPVARLRGIEGQVLLEATVAPDGRVEPDIAIIESIPLLDTAAISAVRQWRFQPARDRDGAPLRVTFRVPVRFVLR
jgi:periplasmic protein TonB